MTQKTEFSGFYNSIEGNVIKYQDTHMAQMISLCTGESGYVPNYNDELQVIAHETKRAVWVSTGAAWLGVTAGWWYINQEPKEIVFDELTEGETKTYLIVVRMDRTSELLAAVKSKYEAEGLEQTLETYEIPLAKVVASYDSNDVTITDVRVPCVRSNSGITKKSGSFSLGFSEMNKFIKCTNTAPINVILPLNATCELPINSEFIICQYTEHPITIVSETSGVVLRSLDNANVSDGQYAAFTLRKIGEDEWFAVGAISS